MPRHSFQGHSPLIYGSFVTSLVNFLRVNDLFFCEGNRER